MTLTAQIDVAVKARLIGAGDLGKPQADINLAGQLVFASGTGAGQVDRIFADNRSLAASAVEDLDLAGVLADPLGTTLTFAKIKAIFIKAAAANPSKLIVGGDANGLAGLFGNVNDVVNVPAGGLELLCAFPGTGITVTAATGDILQVAADSTAGTYSYDIIILGTSA